MWWRGGDVCGDSEIWISDFHSRLVPVKSDGILGVVCFVALCMAHPHPKSSQSIQAQGDAAQSRPEVLGQG